MKKQNHQKKAVLKHRVITMLDRNELEFLHKLGQDSLFTSGHKISYNDILKALVDIAMEAGISAENVGSAEALKEKIISTIRTPGAKRYCAGVVSVHKEDKEKFRTCLEEELKDENEIKNGKGG